MIAVLLVAAALAASRGGESAAGLPGDSPVAAAIRRMPKAHPRVFVTGRDDFAAVNARAKAVSEIGYMRKILLDEAEAWLEKPPKRGMAGMRMTGQREFAESASTLAAAYRLTGERRYAEKCRDYMLAVCDWPDWNPAHYLDVADMLLGLGWGYDWVHEILTDAERAKIRRAIVGKGFDTRNARGWWKKAANNWPQVCWGGIGVAAAAIADAEPDRAREMIEEALRSLPPSLKVYAPKGAYPEGPGYWGYGTGRFVLMMAAFESAFGTNFGLFDYPGFRETALFVDAMTGPTGRFWNFADNSDRRSECVCDGWLARKTGNRGILAYDNRVFREQYARRNAPGFKPNPGEFLAFRILHADFTETADAEIPLDYASEGGNPVVVMRSSLAPDAAYMGLKGGRSSCNHGHMDQGSVLWESDGFRWAYDIGPQNYTKLEQQGVGLWNCGQDGGRWTIFCMNNLSHNLVTVDDRRFAVTGWCNFVSTSFKADAASATLDLSPAVSPYAMRGARRCTLDRKTRIGTVEDGLDGLAPGAKVRWAIVTSATYATVRGRDVILRTKDGQRLILRREGPADVAWETRDMNFQPQPWDYRRDGSTLVSFTQAAPANGRFRSRVRFIPDSTGGILAGEDVRLGVIVGREPGAVGAFLHEPRYGLLAPEGIAAARERGLGAIAYSGQAVGNLTSATVDFIHRAGLKVYLKGGRTDVLVRAAALSGADAIFVRAPNELAKVAHELGARSVRIEEFSACRPAMSTGNTEVTQ